MEELTQETPAVTEDAPATEGTAPSEEETPEEQPEQPEQQSKAQRRIQELILRSRQAEADREALRQELEQLKTQAPKAQPRVEGMPARPVLDDFETVAAWQQADTEWLGLWIEYYDTQKSARMQAQDRERREQEALAASYEGFSKAEAEFKAGMPPEVVASYDAATNNLNMYLLDRAGNVREEAKPLARALLEAGPKVAQELGQDVELLDRLSRADPLTLGREIGRLEQKVADKGRQGRRFSQAPPPEKILSGGKSGSPLDYSKMSGDEYARIRDVQEAERRKLAGY